MRRRTLAFDVIRRENSGADPIMTESVLMRTVANTAVRLQAIEALGVRTAVLMRGVEEVCSTRAGPRVVARGRPVSNTARSRP